MEEGTDTEVRRLWERNDARRAQLAAGEIPPGFESELHARSFVDAEERSLRMAWDDLVRRKRSGELTDPARLDEVSDEIESLAKLHEIPVRFFHGEGEFDDDHRVAKRWRLIAMYSGDTSKLKELYPRWVRFFDVAVNPALRGAFPSINWSHSGHGTDVDEDELPRDYYDYDEDEEPLRIDAESPDDWPEEVKEWAAANQKQRELVWDVKDPYVRPVFTYSIDVGVWSGPPPAKRSR